METIGSTARLSSERKEAETERMVYLAESHRFVQNDNSDMQFVSSIRRMLFTDFDSAKIYRDGVIKRYTARHPDLVVTEESATYDGKGEKNSETVIVKRHIDNIDGGKTIRTKFTVKAVRAFTYNGNNEKLPKMMYDNMVSKLNW